MTENNAGPGQNAASLFPLPDPITEPVRCEAPSPSEKKVLRGAIPGQLRLWVSVSHTRGDYSRRHPEAQEFRGHNVSEDEGMDVNLDDAPVQ